MLELSIDMIKQHLRPFMLHLLRDIRKLSHPFATIQQWRFRQFYDKRIRENQYCQNFLQRYLPEEFFNIPVDDAVILDFGCGMGRFVQMFTTLGYTVDGVDAHSYAYWQKIPSNKPFHVDDSLAFLRNKQDEKYDLILSFLVFECIENYAEYWQEFYRLIKPGGHLSLQLSSKNNLVTILTGKKLAQYSDKELHSFSADEASALLHHIGFQEISIWREGVHLPYLEYYMEVFSNPPGKMYYSLSSCVPEKYRSCINILAKK